MADPPSDSQAGEEQRLPQGSGRPRWVNVFLIIAIVVVLLGVVVFLTGGGGSGGHGPGRHVPSSGIAGEMVPAGVI